ncbi:hypothetical protein HRbin34_00602 [bacterium HR34]|nr:hypothetical protein HRbin34_00602 [bacterium HR34]
MNCFQVWLLVLEDFCFVLEGFVLKRKEIEVFLISVGLHRLFVVVIEVEVFVFVVVDFLIVGVVFQVVLFFQIILVFGGNLGFVLVVLIGIVIVVGLVVAQIGFFVVVV